MGVLQALLARKLPTASIAFIARALEKDLIGYSEHTNSCRVAQSFVQFYGDELDVSLLLEQRAHLRLSTHQFANYVVQCFAEHIPAFREQLTRDVFERASLRTLGRDKFGSNVLEMCVRNASQQQIGALVLRLRARRGTLLRIISLNAFGNYVIKTLIDHCDEQRRTMIINAMHSHVQDLTQWQPYKEQFAHSADLMLKCRQIKLKMDRNAGYATHSKRGRHSNGVKERKNGPRHRRRTADIRAGTDFADIEMHQKESIFKLSHTLSQYI